MGEHGNKFELRLEFQREVLESSLLDKVLLPNLLEKLLEPEAHKVSRYCRQILVKVLADSLHLGQGYSVGNAVRTIPL